VALAKTIRRHPKLGRHVRQVKVGSSRVMVSLIASPALMKTIWQWSPDETAVDVEGQLPLFAKASIA
jgi:hypothetical protein